MLAVAESLLLEHGVKAVTPQSVTQGAGLVRSSFYKYFSSKDELLAAIAIQAFEEWGAEISVALSRVEPGRPRLHAYVDATMRMTADGKHRLASVLQQTEISPSSFDDIMAMHEILAAPLRQVLTEIGLSDPSSAAALIEGLLGSGMQLIAHGKSADGVAAHINRILDEGVHS